MTKQMVATLAVVTIVVYVLLEIGSERRCQGARIIPTSNKPVHPPPPIIDNDGWIPVSERTPAEHECVLFVEKHSRLINYGFYEKVDREKPFVKEFPDGRKICFEKPDGGVWWRFRFGDGLERKNVIAWRPLPKPYKEEKI